MVVFMVYIVVAILIAFAVCTKKSCFVYLNIVLSANVSAIVLAKSITQEGKVELNYFAFSLLIAGIILFLCSIVTEIIKIKEKEDACH